MGSNLHTILVRDVIDLHLLSDTVDNQIRAHKLEAAETKAISALGRGEGRGSYRLLFPAFFKANASDYCAE